MCEDGGPARVVCLSVLVCESIVYVSKPVFGVSKYACVGTFECVECMRERVCTWTGESVHAYARGVIGVLLSFACMC